ncbi:MAG: thioesterase [Planctomycetes bacterium]|nr:thioesterase [Planctomycetota bacterium]
MTDQPSVQDQFAPQLRCFGCGPANPDGLQIKSYLDGEVLRCIWRPEPHHEAYPGMLNGGIVGALLDCHCNWAAALHLMRRDEAAHPPCTVTASYTVKLRRPTPTDVSIQLSATVVENGEDKVVIEGHLEASGKVCASFTGTFVAVKPGHPAYHRW